MNALIKISLFSFFTLLRVGGNHRWLPLYSCPGWQENQDETATSSACGGNELALSGGQAAKMGGGGDCLPCGFLWETLHLLIGGISDSEQASLLPLTLSCTWIGFCSKRNFCKPNIFLHSTLHHSAGDLSVTRGSAVVFVRFLFLENVYIFWQYTTAIQGPLHLDVVWG